MFELILDKVALAGPGLFLVLLLEELFGEIADEREAQKAQARPLTVDSQTQIPIVRTGGD